MHKIAEFNPHKISGMNEKRLDRDWVLHFKFKKRRQHFGITVHQKVLPYAERNT